MTALGLDASNVDELKTIFGNKYLGVGKITVFSDKYFCYSIPNLPGSSGSPILVLEDNKLKIAGIHSFGSLEFKESCGLLLSQSIKRSEFYL